MIDRWNIVEASASIAAATDDKVADKVVDAQIVHTEWTRAASKGGEVVGGCALGFFLLDTLDSLVCDIAEDEVPFISVSGTFLT